MIKGVLITTIIDLPSRGLLSEEKTKGYTGCVECLDDTDAVNLPNNSKIVYMGHRRFLPHHTTTPFHRQTSDAKNYIWRWMICR